MLDNSINTERQWVISKEIAHAEIKIIPESAHYNQFENPLLLAQLLQHWLNTNVN